MKVPWRRLDRQARTDRDHTALALVVVGVDDEGEHEFRVGERSAGRAAQVCAHRAWLDVDVESGVGVERRHLDDRLEVVDPEAARDQLVVVRIQPAELQHTRLAGALGELDRVLADDRDEFAHCVFVNRDGGHFFILPPSWRNRLSRYVPCFGVGSRPHTRREAMSSTN